MCSMFAQLHDLRVSYMTSGGGTTLTFRFQMRTEDLLIGNCDKNQDPTY